MLAVVAAVVVKMTGVVGDWLLRSVHTHGLLELQERLQTLPCLEIDRLSLQGSFELHGIGSRRDRRARLVEDRGLYNNDLDVVLTWQRRISRNRLIRLDFAAEKARSDINVMPRA